MNSQSAESDPLDAIAEAFLERLRRGERPSLTEYTQQHPALAERIRKVFPALIALEELGSVAHAEGRGGPNAGTSGDRTPLRLGEYRIVRELGRGGMGIVYEAVQESLGRHVALKVLPFKSLASPTHLERFLREARAAAGLHHTNIVPVHGVGEHEGVHYYAMQFIKGQSLEAVLREVRRLRAGCEAAQTDPVSDGLAASVAESLLEGCVSAKPSPPDLIASGTAPNEALRKAETKVRGATAVSPSHSQSRLSNQPQAQYFRSVAQIGVQVAEALAYAHRQGILHRDIKPGNLLLDSAGQAWVTDFGLAKAEDSDELTSPGDLVGTLRYMAPERLRGQADARSDIYSLGITLYEMLTLCPAFEDAHRAGLMERVGHEEPVRPRKRDRRIPSDLETLVLKAIAKEPADRYATAEALADDLRRFLGNRPVQARRTPRVERLWRWCRRNPAWAALMACVTSLGIVIVVISSLSAMWLSEEARKARDAEHDAREKLWQSYYAQAQASRLSGRAGHRFQTLETLRKAADLARFLKLDEKRLLQLRNEAVACLALSDLWPVQQLEGDLSLKGGCGFDAQLQHYARSDEWGNLSIRRVADDQEIQRLPGPGYGAGDIYFSRDGRFLAAKYYVGFQDGPRHCTVWDWRSSRLVLQEEVATFGKDVDFSRDSRWFILAGREDGLVRLYDLETGKEEKRFSLGYYQSHPAFHPRGKQVAVSANHGAAKVQVLDLETGKVLQGFEPSPATLVKSLAWSDDGEMLAAAGSDNCIYVWDMGNSTHQRVLTGHRDTVIGLFFSHGGDLLASTSWDGTTRLWDPKTGRQLVSAAGTGLQFSPDDRRLAYRDVSRVGLWQVASGWECRTLFTGALETDTIWEVRFSPDGRLMASTNSTGVRLWDTATAKELTRLTVPADLPCNIHSLAFTVLFHPSGRSLLATGPHGLSYWSPAPDPQGATTGLTVGPREFCKKIPSLQRACMDAKGELLVAVKGWRGHAAPPPETGARGRVIPMWDVPPVKGWDNVVLINLRKPEAEPLFVRHPGVGSVSLSPDGRWLATATWKGTGVMVWDTVTGAALQTLDVRGSAGVVFSPDGQWLVTAEGNEYRFWQVGTWQRRHTVSTDDRESLPGVACFAPDGRTAAIIHGRRSLRLIQPASGEEIATLTAADPQLISWLCISPDGSQLAVATNSSRIQLWDLRRIREQLAGLGLDWDL